MLFNAHLSKQAQYVGPAPEVAGLVTILIHGRNQQPSFMLEVAERIGLDDMSYAAIEAADNTWYPYGFMARLKDNNPSLDYALERLDHLIRELEAKSIKRENIVLLGFSQGACLACEYVYRNPERYGALIALTGGLIGPSGTIWDEVDSLCGTPVFMSNGDRDEWVPLHRTQESAQVFERLGAHVQLEVFPGRAHLVNDQEVEHARLFLERLMHSPHNNA